MAIKLGDLVTVELSATNSASNVYVVARKLEGECLLQHPLAPQCYLLKPDADLNRAPPSLKNSMDKCLDFSAKNLEVFDANDATELRALFCHFVLNRKLSQRQGRTVSAACGKVAAAMLRNNVNAAIHLVVENKGLLDEYNLYWFETMSDIYLGQKKGVSPKQRIAIFNQAGFVLAQLETIIVKQSGGGLHEHTGEVSKVNS